MQINKIEIGVLCLAFFIVGLLLGGIFIETDQEQQSFSDRVNNKNSCEENLFECYVSLQEVIVDKNESRNYVIENS